MTNDEAMSGLEELTEADCRLIPDSRRKALVDRFNRVLELYRLIESECDPDLRRQKSWEGLTKDFEDVRRRMTRDRYKVGFLGPFQSGKSTTFNRVLQGDPAKSGDGGATTATIMRLQPVQNEKHSLVVSYLNEEQFLRKRRGGISDTGFDQHDSDNYILEVIPRRIKAEAPHGVESEDLKGDLGKNLEYLHLLLRSFAVYRDRLGTRKDGVAYENRDRYLNHPRETSWLEAPASPTPLLQDVIVRYETTAIPNELEMIDLPGLGASLNFDTQLTEDYLSDLDGALVFCYVMRIEDKYISELLARLQRHLRTLKGTVWMVYTYADALTNQLRGDSTVFHVISDFLKRQRMPLDQVCLVSNNPAALKQEHHTLDALDGAPELADLKSAWEAVYADGEGGIQRLKNIMAEDVARRVGESSATLAHDKLTDLVKEFVSIGRLQLEGGGFDEETMARCAICINKLSLLVTELSNGRRRLRDKAHRICETLSRKFTELQISVDVLDQNKNFRDQFKRIANRLESALDRLIKAEITAAAYDEILPELEKLEEDRGIMRVASGMSHGLTKTWEDYRREDQNHSDWRDDRFPSFTMNSPFEHDEDDEDDPFTGETFVAMLEEKVRVVGEQAAQALRNRLRERLVGMVRQLDEYANTGIDRQQRVHSEALEQQLDDYDDLAGA